MKKEEVSFFIRFGIIESLVKITIAFNIIIFLSKFLNLKGALLGFITALLIVWVADHLRVVGNIFFSENKKRKNGKKRKKF